MIIFNNRCRDYIGGVFLSETEFAEIDNRLSRICQPGLQFLYKYCLPLQIRDQFCTFSRQRAVAGRLAG